MDPRDPYVGAMAAQLQGQQTVDGAQGMLSQGPMQTQPVNFITDLWNRVTGSGGGMSVPEMQAVIPRLQPEVMSELAKSLGATTVPQVMQGLQTTDPNVVASLIHGLATFGKPLAEGQKRVGIPKITSNDPQLESGPKGFVYPGDEALYNLNNFKYNARRPGGGFGV